MDYDILLRTKHIQSKYYSIIEVNIFYPDKNTTIVSTLAPDKTLNGIPSNTKVRWQFFEINDF